MHKRLAIALAAPLVLANQAHSQGDSFQRCSPHGEPRNLPAVDAIVDSAALIAALKTVAGPEGLEVRIAIHQPSRGVPVLFRVGGDGPGDSALRVSVAAFRKGVTIEGPSVVLHEIADGNGISLSVERSTFCAPVNENTGPEVVTVVTSGAPGPATIRTQPLRIRIGVDGGVREVQLTRPSSSAFDAEAVQAAQRRRYRPARLNGRPVEVWLVNNKVEIIR